MTQAPKPELGNDEPFFETAARLYTEAAAGVGVRATGDCVVSADSNTALGILIASGTLIYGGDTFTIASQQSHTLSSADATNDRWDLVVYDTTNTTTAVRTGTAASSPTPPTLGADEILLGYVYIPAGATDVGSSDVHDFRSLYPIRSPVNSVTGNYTTAGEETIFADTSSSTLTVTLATADAVPGSEVTIVDSGGNAGTNAITIDTEGTETIDGSSSLSISSNFGEVSVISDGTNWFTS